MNPDLMIIGAGPAGGALALLAARRGLDVVLVEAAEFPRHKVCGEFISAEGAAVLRRLGIGGNTLPCIDRWRLTSLTGRSLAGRLPDFPGIGSAALGWSRAEMDRALLEGARRAGARILQPYRYLDTEFEDGRFAACRIHPVGQPEQIATLRPLVLVAADGRRSRLAALLQPSHVADPRRPDGESWWGLKSHRTGSGPGRDRIDLHLFPGGYLGVGPIENERTNLCMLVRRDTLREAGGGPEDVYRKAALKNPIVRTELAGLEADGRWQAVGPLRFGPRLAAAAGVWFVGDAAGTVDPFSGEGISHALLGAEALLPRVEEAAARGGVDCELSEDWQRCWSKHFRTAGRSTRRLGRLLGHPRLAGWTIAALQNQPALVARLARQTRTASHQRLP